MFRQIKDALFVNNKIDEKQEKNNYDEVEISIAALLALYGSCPPNLSISL